MRLDFRSDTVTLPTEEMRRAMAQAELGDDQYGEDPTVRALEERSAEVVGKEAALFVVSGIAGNLCAILAQTNRGDEVILGELAHIYQNEVGAYSVFGGLHARTVPNRGPCPEPADVAAAIRPAGVQFARSALLCLENTHNWLSGAVVAPAEMNAVCQVARNGGLAIHLDGARLFNAAVALGVDPRILTAQVDTVQFCFSKGLAAPVGSVVCGSREVIERARHARKMLGGAMRQAGVLAAACLVGLEKMRDRLAEDHLNAKRLASGLAEISGVEVDASKVVTNIVAFGLSAQKSGDRFRDGCTERGLLLSCYGGDWRKLRAVTHLGLDASQVDAALRIVRDAAGAA
jgi:threonine aldolase